MQPNMALNFWLAHLDLWDAEFTSCAPGLVLHSREYQAHSMVQAKQALYQLSL